MTYQHDIEFTNDTELHLNDPTGKTKVKRKLTVKTGTRAKVMLRPFVKNLVERADLAFSDGSEATGVKYADFRFL